MKNYLMTCIAVLVLGSVGVAQQRISEVKHNGSSVAAPKECLLVFREFFSYLQKDEPGIVKDEQAQQRWLTQQLRKALKEKLATFTSPQDDPDYPSNRTFIESWDSPTTY